MNNTLFAAVIYHVRNTSETLQIVYHTFHINRRNKHTTDSVLTTFWGASMNPPALGVFGSGQFVDFALDVLLLDFPGWERSDVCSGVPPLVH